jgi:cytochrome oxidase Cu insertion factor (SCO1/SenC/PrrC family)
MGRTTCPKALFDVSAVFKELAADKKVAALPVTVYRERDKPDILNTYLVIFPRHRAYWPSKTEAIVSAKKMHLIAKRANLQRPPQLAARELEAMLRSLIARNRKPAPALNRIRAENI